MLEFERLGFKSTSARRGFGNRPGMATNAQIAKIRSLFQEWSGGKGGARALDAWVNRTFHVAALRWLSFDNGIKAVEALKKMAERRRAA